MQRILKLIFFTGILFYSTLSISNTFNFKAIGSLPTSVQGGQTVSASYLVTSVGTFAPSQYHIIFARLTKPANVSLDLSIPNACQVNPISPTGCILKLNIIGPVSGPVKICDDWKGRPGLNCYVPSNPKEWLQVSDEQPPVLIVTPPTTFLSATHVSQIFTVVNISPTITAMNITMTIPANVLGQLVGPPVYLGCSAIAPLGSCTITITMKNAPSEVSGIATVQGTNSAGPAPTVAINIAAPPVLTVSPLTSFLGSNGIQQFVVVNTSATTAANNVTLTIPANVQASLAGQPVYSGCASIAALGSCTITITAASSPAAASGIATVQGTNTALPAATVAITIGAAPAITVSPPTTILGANGSQQFTVVNTSTTTSATNVAIIIPANIQAQLLGAPVYNGCSSIAPLGTCTITITAIASPIAQSGVATVQGSNTAAPAPSVTITTGAAPVLTISPPTTLLGGGQSQTFTVTNTSNTISALNVTMTIPANVLAQLTGQPVYAGCGSIAPLGTCTMTITAIATPTDQSGIATVQGTNTAAPAPTVAITTGAAPVLTVSPQATNLSGGQSQIFTVTNTGTVPAQNVTMTIPANVQAQLTGPPVYSLDCASLGPMMSTCTMTITAIASPVAQSGTATIQGTNTAAPSPVVSIFILPTCTVLGSSTVTNAGGSNITGGVCVSPGTAITGFPPGTATGGLHSNDSTASAAHSESISLYNTMTGLTCGTNLTGMDLSGMTLSPGVYCFNTSAALTSGILTLNGSATDQWYFQIGSTLTTSGSPSVTLTGGALVGNVFWQVGSSATFGTATSFKGQVIVNTSITMTTGASNQGRLWANNGAVTLDTNNVFP